MVLDRLVARCAWITGLLVMSWGVSPAWLRKPIWRKVRYPAPRHLPKNPQLPNPNRSRRRKRSPPRRLSTRWLKTRCPMGASVPRRKPRPKKKLPAGCPADQRRSFQWTDKLTLTGYLQSDVRFQVEDKRGTKPKDGYNFEMNQNIFNLRLEAFPADSVKMVVDARLRYFGFTQYRNLEDLDDRKMVDDFNVELNEAYLNILTEHVGIKIGRQQVTWGSADTFNQVDYVNARDLSDPLEFAAKVPNQMVQLEFYPTEWMTLTTVWIPIFKPSQLPLARKRVLPSNTTRKAVWKRPRIRRSKAVGGRTRTECANTKTRNFWPTCSRPFSLARFTSRLPM